MTLEVETITNIKTGTIKLYNTKGVLQATKKYYGKGERRRFIEQWTAFFNGKGQRFYFLISPDIMY